MSIWSAEIKELEKIYESLEGHLPGLGKELKQLLQTSDANVVMLYSRRCLEVIITDLCECELKRQRKTEPLKGIIDKLHKEDKVPSHLITSMHGLNDLSTYGAHPKDFDPEQVKPVLVNLDIIIKWYLKYKGTDIKGKEEKKKNFGEETFRAVTNEMRIETKKNHFRITKPGLLSGMFITVILIIAAILAYPKIFKNNSVKRVRSLGERITIAVMPFENLTNDDSKNFWQEMIQDNLITSMSNSEELRVRQTESIMTLLQNNDLTNYASLTPTVAGKISQKLDAEVFIHGSINQIGKVIRLNAKIIDSETEEIIKSFQIDGTDGRVLQMTDSLSVMTRNFLIISEMEMEIPEIYKLSGKTNSPEAYRYFIQGRNSFVKEDYPGSINWYSKAIAIDSNFFQAMISTSLAYYNLFEYETWFSTVFDKLYLLKEAKNWCMRVYKKTDQMTIQQKINTQWLHATCFGTPYDKIKYLKQLIDFDDQIVTAYFNLGNCYNDLYQYDMAIPEYKKALEIFKKWDLKPYWAANCTYLGQMYYKTGQYKKAEKVLRKAEKDFPDDIELIGWQGVLALSQGDTIGAQRYFEKMSAILRGMSMPEATVTALVAFGYNAAGFPDEAEKKYRKALSLDTDNPDRVNSLSYFLIDKDRNINEGLELINKELEINPDNFIYLHTKGWGLFKQGKYTEALDILQESWDRRMKDAIYNHEAFLHLEAAKKALAEKK